MAAPDSSGAIEIPGPWQHRYVAANGARFHVAEVRDPVGGHEPTGGPLVLLLHGFPEFWWTWRQLLPVLASRGYRAAAMDLRGYGGSDKTPRGYDPFTLAGDVTGVVKALGARSAVLVGHSWGGYVGWTAATLHPREVSALATLAAPHPADMMVALRSRGAGPLRAHLASMQVPVLPEHRLGDPTSGYLRQHLVSWSSPTTSFPTDEEVSTYQEALRIWPAPHCAVEYHRWLVRSRMRVDGRRFNAAMRGEISQPVCSIDGADDPVLPGAATSVAGSRVRGPHVRHVVPDAGHFLHEERPDEVGRLLLGWLDEVT